MVQGPVLAPLRVTGVGGAFAGYAEGVDAIASPPVEVEEALHLRGRAQLEHLEAVLDANGALVPDSAVPGNSSGLTSTIHLFDLDPAEYPVIALTAHAAREDQQRAFEAGCNDYITKPIEREVLVAAIKKHLAKAAERRAES